jgi:hypothetical protein
MTDARTIRKHFNLRELTRFTSAALAWAVFATAVMAIVLCGASAGIRPFNSLVKLHGHSQGERGARATPGLRTGPDEAEPGMGGGVGYIKDTALHQRRDWEEGSLSALI